MTVELKQFTKYSSPAKAAVKQASELEHDERVPNTKANVIRYRSTADLM